MVVSEPEENFKSNMNPAAQEDCFDRLPDALVLLIFNKLGDAKFLTLCLSVSRRFASLVPMTDAVNLSVPPRKSRSKSKCMLGSILLKILGNKFASKLLHSLLDHIISPRSLEDADDASYYSPTEVLRHFEEVKSLQIKLSSSDGEVGSEAGDDTLLKWKAKFGSELKSCVILGARSFIKSIPWSAGNFRDIGPQALTDEELKVRVLWMISCLIAASDRHRLSKQIIAQHQTLQNIVISDVNKQGMLFIGKDEVLDVRSSINSSMATLKSPPPRTRVPELCIHMKYAPLLELPASGFLMKGATLVMIRPVVGKEADDDDDDVNLFDFDGEEYEKKAFKESIKQMLKIKKSYVMTIDSF